MPEYIERRALMVALCEEIVGDGDYYSGKDAMQDQIRDMVSQFPQADVAPVAHGRWIEKTAPEGCRYFECSNCGAHENRHTAIKGYYCWRCGAKMDGGADNG